jgi:tRNA (cmo5U34)-methyltransferase
MVADAFPNVHLTLVDISDEMLGKARARFASRPNVDYRTLNFEREPLTGQYDVAISALALHHVTPAKLVDVFRNAYAALVNGGTFINADQTLGTTDANEQKYDQAWRDAVKALGSTDDDIDAALERMKADQTATLEDQLRWLREAGFNHVDCWFKRYRFAVYSGKKRDST